MQFREVPGQDNAKEGLLHAVHSGKLPHALLLLGQEGTGGLPLALALAAYVLCEDRSEEDSCGKCPSCRKIQRLEHPDLHFSFPAIRPERSKDGSYSSADWLPEFRKFIRSHPFGTAFDWLQDLEAGNKQGNITARECREIIEKLSLKSYEGREKILILWRPEYLNKEGNILLKLMEEPPPGTYLFLVASQMEDILATILSRVQVVRLAPVAAPVLAESLVARGLTDDARAAGLAAVRAGGSYGEALRLLEGHDKDLFPDFRNWFNAIFRNMGNQFAPFADTLSKEGRERVKDFLEYALHLLEAALRRHYAPEMPLTFPAEEVDFISRLAAHRQVHAGSLSEMAEAISEAHHHIGRNANAKIVLHALSIRLARLAQGRMPALG